MEPLLEASDRVWHGMKEIAPTLGLCILVFLLTIYLTKRTASVMRNLLSRRIESRMLRNLVARLISIPVFLVGFYIILDMSGLQRVAATLIGGTGLLGIVIGIAFRNITENFLASILLSIQRPFVLGDMIKVLEYVGLVEAMTTRGTVLITLDGNHVQIPNTTIYKEAITNYSSNPNIRQSFTVGIGYDESISQVQGLIIKVLRDHQAVLDNPDPLVLAEKMASSTINLGVYFWVNGQFHSALKVRSSVIRLVKSALVENGIDMPDDAREILFPQGLPSLIAAADAFEGSEHKGPTTEARRERSESEQTVNNGEGDLGSEKGVLQAQARNGSLGPSNVNLLQGEA